MEQQYEYLTLADAAVRYGISAARLRHYIRGDPPRLRTVRIGQRLHVTTDVWMRDLIAGKRLSGRPRKSEQNVETP